MIKADKNWDQDGLTDDHLYHQWPGLNQAAKNIDMPYRILPSLTKLANPAIFSR